MVLLLGDRFKECILLGIIENTWILNLNMIGATLLIG